MGQTTECSCEGPCCVIWPGQFTAHEQNHYGPWGFLWACSLPKSSQPTGKPYRASAVGPLKVKITEARGRNSNCKSPLPLCFSGKVYFRLGIQVFFYFYYCYFSLFAELIIGHWVILQIKNQLDIYNGKIKINIGILNVMTYHFQHKLNNHKLFCIFYTFSLQFLLQKTFSMDCM